MLGFARRFVEFAAHAQNHGDREPRAGFETPIATGKGGERIGPSAQLAQVLGLKSAEGAALSARGALEPVIETLIARLLERPEVSGVIAAAPATDTIKRAPDGETITSTEDRSALWAAQTPQVFRTEDLRRAHASGDVAVATDDAMLVERLLAAGAAVNARNDYGASALGEAAAIGSTRVIELLLANGADPNGANPEGETALMLVARTGNVEAARLLLEAGADVNASEQWGGQSALMWAVIENHIDVARLLVARGADVERACARSAASGTAGCSRRPRRGPCSR